MESEDGGYPRSDLNGIIKGFIRLSDERAQSLLNRQEAQGGWLTFRAVPDEHSGVGQVRLVNHSRCYQFEA